MTGEAAAILAYGALSLILALYVSSRLKSLMDLKSELFEAEENRKNWP